MQERLSKSKVSKSLRSRTTIQVGAEIFGDSSKDAELDSINLMLKEPRYCRYKKYNS